MRLKQPSDAIVVGRFGGPHGVKGKIKLFAYGQPPKQLVTYKPFLIEKDGRWQPLNILHCEAKPDFLLVTIEGIDSREVASQLTNTEVAVYASSLPKLNSGQYYWQELVGLEVINTNKVHLGTVTELLATGANDVLVVKNKVGVERLIPFVIDEHVVEINEKNKLIRVAWDEDF